MAHNLEIREDGTASMFSSDGITPWHGLGNVIQGKATAEEAIQHAGLDWEVIKEPLYFGSDYATYPGWYAMVRSTDRKPLGHTADGYHIFQNRDAFSFMDAVTDAGSGEAHYTTAGALAGGKKIFITLKLDKQITVAGDEDHDLYLLLTNSHDGKGSLTGATTMIRGVCENTVTLGLRTAKTKWSIRHKSTLEGKVQEAREQLKLSFKYADAFEKEVEKLLKVEITKDKFNKIAEQIIKPSKEQHDRDVAALMDVFEFEKTVNETNVKGTGWAAYNAVTFFGDHKKKYHTAESRFNSLNSGFAEDLRNKAHSLILASV